MRLLAQFGHDQIVAGVGASDLLVVKPDFSVSPGDPCLPLCHRSRLRAHQVTIKT